MIRNIITPASNSSELALLRRAKEKSVTTGGWVRKVHDQAPGVRTRDYTGQAKSDLDNLRVADFTVLTVAADGAWQGSLQFCKEWSTPPYSSEASRLRRSPQTDGL